MHVFQLVFSTDNGGKVYTTQGFCFEKVMDVFSWDIMKLIPVYGNRPDLSGGGALIFAGISRCRVFEISWQPANISYREYRDWEEGEEAYHIDGIARGRVVDARHTTIQSYVNGLFAMDNFPPPPPTPAFWHHPTAIR